MLPEQIAGAGDAGDPEGRSEEVEESKRSPAHAQDAGQRSGKNAQAEDEAGEENCGGAVVLKQVLAALHRGRLDPKESLVAIEQRTPAIMAESVAQIVAERCGTGCQDNDSSDMEPVVGIGEKTCQQERGLTGDGEAGVFAEQCQSHGPVTVIGDEFAQRVKNRGAHEEPVLCCQFSVKSAFCEARIGSADEEIDERTVKVLGRLFVRQMTDARERHQASIAKIPAQRLGGLRMTGAVASPPNEESGVIANLRKRRFQFREVCRPVPYDAQTVMERVVLEHGHKVAIERIRRNS